MVLQIYNISTMIDKHVIIIKHYNFYNKMVNFILSNLILFFLIWRRFIMKPPTRMNATGQKNILV